MNTQPIVRSSRVLCEEMRALMRDPAGEGNRWGDAEYVYALNQVLATWSSRVRVPAVYELADGIAPNVYAYELPRYIRPPLTVEMLTRGRNGQALGEGDGATWKEIPGWHLEPDGAGGQMLRIYNTPYATQGRVIYYVSNGAMPVVTPLLASGIGIGDTTIVVDAALDVGNTGWIEIGREIIEYHGVNRASASTTLTNCVRGVFDTATDAHSIGANVYWCVGVDNAALWEQLRNQWEINLHRMYLTDASETEKRRHQEQIMYLKGLVDDFWARGYISQPSPKFVMKGRGMAR